MFRCESQYFSGKNEKPNFTVYTFDYYKIKKVEKKKVFAKIILYITIFFKKFFQSNVQKKSIEGASDFRVTDNNFLS